MHDQQGNSVGTWKPEYPSEGRYSGHEFNTQSFLEITQIECDMPASNNLILACSFVTSAHTAPEHQRPNGTWLSSA